MFSTATTNFYFLRICNPALAKNRHCNCRNGMARLSVLVGHKLSYKLSGFGDLESVDSLCRDGVETQYMQLSPCYTYLAAKKTCRDKRGGTPRVFHSRHSA